MERAYDVYWTKTNTASATVPMGNLLITGATVRPSIFSISSGSDAVADNATSYDIQRTSARGTQTASVVANALDSANPAATALFDTTWSGNPTITGTSTIWRWGQNQRAAYLWIANPGRELIIPATANAGLALVAVANSPSAFSGVFSLSFVE
jgi:hypothetical protein